MTTINTTAKIPAIQADISGSTLTLTFSNGEEIIVNANSLSDEIRAAAIMHGLKQKLVDAAAISRNPDTGASATIRDKYEAVLEVANRIQRTDGTWNKVREGGEGSSGQGILVRALVKMSGKSRAEVEEMLAPKTKEEKAALRKNPKVASVIAELQSAESSIDSDALLDGLLGDAPAKSPKAKKTA